MVGGVAGWLALDVTRSRRVALVRGGMAILGHLLRIALSVVLIAGSAVADGAIAATMLLVFLGIGILSVDTLRGNRLAGWQASMPLVTVAVGLVTAVVYSIDKAAHFVLLGLVWGPAWLLVGYVARSQTSQRSGEVGAA
jgi:hypothetical protein